MENTIKTYNKRSKKSSFEKMMDISLNDKNLQDLIAYNELKHTYQFLKDFEGIKANNYFEDKHMAVLKWYFINIHELPLADASIMKWIQLEGMKNTINPIKDWLNNLKWDGIHRLDSWLHIYTGCELNKYTSQVGVILLCGAIKRIMEPGCKFDYMVILEGEQGIMKSTLFEVLGGDYFISLSFGYQEKEIVENIQGAWFIEIADMNGFAKKDIEWLRAFITRKSDRCRLPYARTSGDFARQNIFVGTTNPSGDNEYLKDDTGNRRFFPILCSKMNVHSLRDVRDQLFAEAFTRYKNELLYLTGEAEKIAKQEQSNREETDVWSGTIRHFILNKNITNMNEILNNCLHIDLIKVSMSDKMRVGKIMRKLKWDKKQNRYGEWEYHSPNYVPETNTPAVIPQIDQLSNQQQGLNFNGSAKTAVEEIDWSS
jgi:putative DNA primase/helicase